jgi:hypothetical protein
MLLYLERGIAVLGLGYWNVNKNPRATVAVADLCLHTSLYASSDGIEKDAVVILSEHKGIDFDKVNHLILSTSNRLWNIFDSSEGRFKIITNLTSSEIKADNEIYKGIPLIITRKNKRGYERYNLIGVHLASPVGNWNKQTKIHNETYEFSRALFAWESNSNCSGTIVIGDFNQDPYSDPMVNTLGLNAVMCAEIAIGRVREAGRAEGRQKIPYLYNPTWEFLGTRRTGKCPGSYFNHGDTTDSAYWHALDQILIRPQVIKHLIPGTCMYASDLRGKMIVGKDGAPSKKTFSDHLPLVSSFEV